MTVDRGSDVPRTPRTEAGRAMLNDAYVSGIGPGHRRDVVEGYVLRIEAEAASRSVLTVEAPRLAVSWSLIDKSGNALSSHDSFEAALDEVRELGEAQTERTALFLMVGLSEVTELVAKGRRLAVLAELGPVSRQSEGSPLTGPALCGEVLATCLNEAGHPGDHWHPFMAPVPTSHSAGPGAAPQSPRPVEDPTK